MTQNHNINQEYVASKQTIQWFKETLSQISLLSCMNDDGVRKKSWTLYMHIMHACHYTYMYMFTCISSKNNAVTWDVTTKYELENKRSDCKCKLKRTHNITFTTQVSSTDISCGTGSVSFSTSQAKLSITSLTSRSKHSRTACDPGLETCTRTVSNTIREEEEERRLAWSSFNSSQN